MYQFYYDYLKPKYGDKCIHLFTDADSLCCHFQIEDVNTDVDVVLNIRFTQKFASARKMYSRRPATLQTGDSRRLGGDSSPVDENCCYEKKTDIARAENMKSEKSAKYDVLFWPYRPMGNRLVESIARRPIIEIY